MTAAITDAYKKVALNALKKDFQSSSGNYFMALGRSMPWENGVDSAPVAADSDISSDVWVNSARDAFQVFKIVERGGLVIPRVDWTYGTVYEEYDDAYRNNETQYYVMNDDLRVYAVVHQPKTITGAAIPSIVEPTLGVGVSVAREFKTSDGYVWRYMYQIGPEDANAFLTTNFMPVQHIDSDTPAVTAVEVEQQTLQNEAVDGQIINIQLDSGNGGSGYATAPTVVISGDGSGAAATAIIDGGVVTAINLDSNGSGVLLHGINYNRATVTLTGGGGTGAVARAVIAKDGGFGFDPTDDLRASALMFNTQFDGDENGAIVAENDYRQVSLLKDPKQFGSDALYTGTEGNAMKALVLAVVNNAFVNDELLTGQSNNSQARVVYFNGITNTLYYYQNEETGYGPFTAGEIILGSGGGNATLDNPVFEVDPAIDAYSGDVLYIDNINPITRTSTQIEDVKIVIQL